MKNFSGKAALTVYRLIAQGPGAVICGLSLGLLVGAAPVEAQNQATVKSVLSVAPFSKQDVENVQKGKTVATDLTEVSKRELAVGAACLIEDDVSGRLDRMRSEQRPLFQRKILKAFGRLDVEEPMKSLNDLTLGEKAAAEAKKYINFKPGFGLNLSAEEIKAYQALQAIPPGEFTVAEVQDLLRRQLLARYRAYRQNGISGMAEYAREKNSTARPAREMRASLEIAHGLQHLFPEFYRVWMNYPTEMPPGAKETFFWSRLDLDKRPALVLVHRIEATLEDREVIGERYFYCSRFCNVGMTLIALLPVQEGTLFLYGNRFWVDFWTGFPSIKHSVGQKVMRGTMQERIEQGAICR